MFRGTCSSIEMLKEHMDRESLGTPVLGLLCNVNLAQGTHTFQGNCVSETITQTGICAVCQDQQRG